jgi:hypothetical protein
MQIVMRRITLLALLALAVGNAGCGAGTRAVVVASVAHVPITSAELSDWMGALASEHFVPDPPRYSSCISRARAQGQQPIGDAIREQCEAEYAALKQKALRFLVSSDWLIGEAVAEHRGPSTREIELRLARRGRADGAVSQSARRLLAERELAAAQLTAALHRSELPITRKRIARYYREHIAHFEHREQRYFDIYEYFRSPSAARGLLSEIERGQPHLARIPLRESIKRPRNGEAVVPWKRSIFHAILAAKPGVYVGPVLVSVHLGYVIFRVTRVVPRTVEPLSRVEGEIAAGLAREEHHRKLAGFLSALRSRWVAKTSCRVGYVVPGCREYNGGSRAEALVGGLS